MTRERRLVVAALGAWIAVEILLLASAPVLGHDESQYAIQARGDREWLYVSTGTVAVARIGIWFGGGAVAMRIVPALLSCGFIVASWLAGRVAYGERVGAIAAAVMAGASPIALRSTELLSDLPSAACMLAGIALIVRELERASGPSWRLLAVAPAFAGAFYLRFGHAPVIALTAVAAAVLWWRSVIARPLPVLATLAAFAALLVPHVEHALSETGSVFGILAFSRRVTATEGTADGLIDYVTSNPFRMYGPVVAPLLVVALAALVRPPARWRPALLFGIVGIGQFVIVGLTGTAQSRYVCVATSLLVIVAVERLVRAATTRRDPLAAKIATLAIAATWLFDAGFAVPLNRYLDGKRRPLAVAGETIARDAGGSPCKVIATELPPLVWQTKCVGIWGGNAPINRGSSQHLYVVSNDPVDVAAIAAAQDTTAVALPMPRGTFSVWLLVPRR
jgi:hypothetical protein